MSGGAYNYAYTDVSRLADDIAGGHQTNTLVQAFCRHMKEIADVCRDIEWADSGDSVWDDALRARLRAIVTPAREREMATEEVRVAVDNLIVALDRAAGQSDA